MNNTSEVQTHNHIEISGEEAGWRNAIEKAVATCEAEARHWFLKDADGLPNPDPRYIYMASVAKSLAAKIKALQQL